MNEESMSGLGGDKPHWKPDVELAAEVGLHKCFTPDCDRRVSAMSRHCCAPCAIAADDLYEIDAHTPGCNERHQRRSSDNATYTADKDDE